MSNREYIGNYTIVCCHCGAKFRSNRATAKYCSQSCKYKAHRQAHRNDKLVVARPHEIKEIVKVVEVKPKPKPKPVGTALAPVRQSVLSGVGTSATTGKVLLASAIVSAVAIGAVCIAHKTK